MKSKSFVVLILFIIYFLFELFYLTRTPNIWVDENWYANTAYNFSIGKGIINTVPGSQGGDDLFLFPMLLGLFYKVFGTSAFISRLFSAIIGFLSLAGLYLTLHELKLDFKISIFVCSLFIFSNVNYIIFRTVRPEALVLFFLVWSFCFLIKGFNENNIRYYFLSTVIICFSFLAHPNGGLLVIMWGAFFLIESVKEKNIKIILVYFTGGFLVLGLLMLYIYTNKNENIVSFIVHLTTQEKRFNNGLYETNNSIVTLIKTTLNYFYEYFRSYTLGVKRIYILFFEVGALFLGLSYLRKNKLVFIASIIGLTYLIISIIAFHPFSTRVFANVIFFSLIVFALILNKGYRSKSKSAFIFLSLGFLYLLNNMAGDLFILYRDRDNSSYSYIEKNIESIVPEHSKVLTLLNFWFPLKESEVFTDYTRWGITDFTCFDDLLEKKSLNYVVISDYMIYSGSVTTKSKESAFNLEKNILFYKKVSGFTNRCGQLIASFKTNNYGTINIYKIICSK